MAEPRAEPFNAALSALRDRLQRGRLAPGSRITSVELADELRLSTTPVREALSRLAGEGLLEERRGQGYFVRLLSAGDIADLYRLGLAHLLIAHEARRPTRAVPGALEAHGDGSGPVEAVEALFRRWVADAGSRFLIRSFRALQVQLGPVRRLEPRVVDDLAAEAGELLAMEEGARRAERLTRLRRFHARRIRQAQALADLLEGVHAPGSYADGHRR